MDSRRRWIVAVSIACVLLGAAFRLWHLGGPTFSADETVATQHVGGYVEGDVLNALAGNRPVRAREVLQFGAPARERSPRSVVLALAAEDPQHPPLFYVAERWWMQLAGSSPAASRFLPALIGIVGIVTAWWLCGLLTGSVVGGWAGAAFYALSPFEVVYAQQVREYSLFATLTLLSTALLVVAIRRARISLATAYATAAIAGLYTFSLFGLVLAAHVTVLCVSRPARAASLRVAGAIALSAAAWLPWVAVLILRRNLVASTNDWSATRWSLAALAAKWLFNATLSSFDLFYRDIRWAPVAAIILVILGVALWELRRAPSETSTVVWSLLVWSFGALALLDVAAGGHRSTVARYTTPAYCALVIALAAWVAADWRRDGRRFLVCVSSALALCVAATISLSARTTSDVWWDNAKEGAVRPIAATVDALRLPVVVTDVNWPLLVNLARYTQTDPMFILAPADHVAEIARAQGPVLVVTTSNASRTGVSVAHGVRSRLLLAASTTSQSASLFHSHLVRTDGTDRDTEVDDSHAAVLEVVGTPLALRKAASIR